ncbi:uncharacterized protein LOC126898835 isoform X2 [Daktulosphaira vitifoliae]|uniref:uncharacterized protein LOC126898835 isoform X2 n=1 Tax=Daktulosphaira vitifoliae TaxID=58002 RepID=UPI0021AACD06|nr:uncharacterized protein LOC126898835 isoform X2 [Daktulosphaira vitifoliae]
MTDLSLLISFVMLIYSKTDGNKNCLTLPMDLVLKNVATSNQKDLEFILTSILLQTNGDVLLSIFPSTHHLESSSKELRNYLINIKEKEQALRKSIKNNTSILTPKWGDVKKEIPRLLNYDKQVILRKQIIQDFVQWKFENSPNDIQMCSSDSSIPQKIRKFKCNLITLDIMSKVNDANEYFPICKKEKCQITTKGENPKAFIFVDVKTKQKNVWVTRLLWNNKYHPYKYWLEIV